MNRKHLLVGLLHCGKCGNTMICQKRKRSNGTEYKKYICKTYHQHGRESCDQPNLDGEWLEDKIVNDLKYEISKKLEDENAFNYEESDIAESLYEKITDVEDKIEEIQKHILVAIKSKELMSDDLYEATIKSINKEHEDLIKDKEMIQYQLNNVKNASSIIKNEMMEWLSKPEPSEDETREFLITFIDKIIATEERVNTLYKYR